MPNHCYNEITIKSTKEDIEKIVEHLRGKDSMFDFNTLLPMPREIKDIRVIHKGDEKYHYSQEQWTQAARAMSPPPKAPTLSVSEVERQIIKGEQMPPAGIDFPDLSWAKDNPIDSFTIRRLQQQQGATTPHDWSVKHWGTPDNAEKVEYLISPVKTLSLLHTKITEPCQVVYTMLTAWSEPRPIVKALRDYLQLPNFNEHLVFEWRFRDEMEHYDGIFTKTDEI